jgi:hypothetical protein
MNTVYQEGVCGIQFQMMASVDDVLDRLAFICLVEIKFDGKRHSAHPYWDYQDGKKRRFLAVELRFPNWELFDGAKLHCRRNLTEAGSVLEDYAGALDAADPERKLAAKLQNEALAAESSN